MAKQSDVVIGPLSKVVPIAIKSYTTLLAKQYDVAPARVRRILERTARDWHGNPLPRQLTKKDDEERHGFCFQPSLGQALEYLPPEDALTLFETEDLDRLAQRVALTAYLADPARPLHNLNELACLTEALITHLEYDRTFLIKTGYSQISFHRSPFLETRLTLLYPVKIPLAFSTTGLWRGEEQYEYFWPDKVIEMEIEPAQPPLRPHNRPRIQRGEDGKPYTADGAPISLCSYKEAALLAGLDPERADRLEAGRATLLRLRIAMLREFLHALRRRRADGLWDNCVRLLTQALPAKDIDFYLTMDKFYSGFDVETKEKRGTRVDMHAGGVTDLLNVIGHYEKELTLGTLAQTRDALGTFLQPDQLGCPRLAFDSYYRALGRPERVTWDAALDRFQALDLQEQVFWPTYASRVQQALTEEFYEVVEIPTKVKRKDVPKFKPYISTFADWAKTHLEINGSLPQLALTQPTKPDSAESNVFRQEGEYWTIIYAGKATRLRESPGLQYIAYLLAHPGQTFHVLALETAVRGIPPDSIESTLNETSEAQLAEHGLAIAGHEDGGEIVDQKAREQYKNRAKELQQELAEAKRNNDKGQSARLQRELEFVIRELRPVYGRQKNRQPNSHVEQARINIGKLIRKALKKIAKHNPSLHQHLRAIKTGTSCSYTPVPPPVSWSL